MERCRFLSFSPDGTRLVSIHEGIQTHSPALRLILWDVDSSFPRGLHNKSVLLSRQRTASDPPTFVHFASFSSDGEYLLSGGSDEAIYCWDVVKKAFLFKIPAGIAATFSLDGSFIYSVRQDGLVQRWERGDTGTKKWNRISNATRNNYIYVSDIAFSPNRQKVALSDGFTMLIMDPLTGKVQCQFPIGSEMMAARFTSDSEKLIVARRNSLVFFDTKSGKELYSKIVGTEVITAFATSGDGKLVTAGTEGTVALIDQMRLPCDRRKCVPHCQSDLLPITLSAKLSMQKNVYILDLRGQSADEVSKSICSGHRSPKFDINYCLSLHNSGVNPIVIFGELLFTFYLVGPGAMNIPTAPHPRSFDLRHRQSITIPPGKNKVIRFTELKSSFHETCWLLSGQYTLHANCCIAISSRRPSEQDDGAGLEFVTIVSEPLHLTVFEREEEMGQRELKSKKGE